MAAASQAPALAGASPESQEAASISPPTPALAGGSVNSLDEILSSFITFNAALCQFSPQLSNTIFLQKPTPNYHSPLSAFELFSLFRITHNTSSSDLLSSEYWSLICDHLNVENSLSRSLRHAYEQTLLPFKEFIQRQRSESFEVYADQGAESGRSLSGSPSTNATDQNTATDKSPQISLPLTFRNKILNKKEYLQDIVRKHHPGQSATGFLSFYQTEQAAMASTRSSLREGLRQAPRANQPFIPDTAPVRQTRSLVNTTSTPQNTTPSGHIQSSHAAGVDSSNIMSGDFEIDHFEGKDVKQVPMSTRDVPTPGNKPDLFKRAKQTKQPNFYDPYYPLKFVDVPRTDDIYKRALMSVRCQIPDEVDFGLFHLVQMSHQQDNFLFEGFPLLAETLMEKAMEITKLCTGVEWDFERDPYKWPLKKDRVNVLYTLMGTHDILTRIKAIPITLPEDTLETAEFAHDLMNIKEASLILRNMCMLGPNAYYIANQAKGLLRDFLVVMLNLPQPPRFNELKNDALEIAEQVTKFMPTAPDDPLCISLYKCFSSKDRAHLTGSLGALCHFSSEIPGVQNRAMEYEFDKETMQDLINFTLIKTDAELLNGTMDWFYQYTLDRKNVERLARMVNMPTILIPILVSLLTYQSHDVVHEIVVQEEKIAPPPSAIPKVPAELFKKLMTLPEPNRSSQWLRCCFVEDPDCEITQIALWQAYQYRFGAPQPGNNPQQPNGGALAAADFIKNVSTTFNHAQAQVVPATGPGGQTGTKFIIRGIRPLETALTFENWPYLYCKWSVGDQPGHFCDRAFAEPRELRLHVFVDHMDLDALDEPNQYNYDRAKLSPKACRWNQCTKYKAPTTETEMVVEHVGGHLPQDRPIGAKPSPPKRQLLQPRISRQFIYRDTPIDEHGEPIGVAYKATLIMRNLAWYLPDTGHAEKTRGVPWNEYAFITHRQAIITKFDENRTLRGPLADLINLIHRFI